MRNPSGASADLYLTGPPFDKVILVVAGTERERELLDRASAAQPYRHVECLGTGRDALERLRRSPVPDVVLIDGELGDVEPVEVVHRIRADRRLEGTTAVVVGGRAAGEIGLASLEAGCDGFVAAEDPRIRAAVASIAAAVQAP